MIKKTILIFCVVLFGSVAFAIDPDCPKCGGSGWHQEGGTSIRRNVYVKCRNCGKSYDAFGIHRCECRYCANYVPQSSDPNASWNDDIGYIVATEYARQIYSPVTENEPSIEIGKSYNKTKFKPLPVNKVKDSDGGIPSWLCYVAGIALVIFLKWFFDE